MVGDHGWRKKSRQLDVTVTVRRTHHGYLDTLVVQAGHAAGPVAFDHGLPFKFKAQLDKELDRRFQVFDHNANVVHSLNSHVSVLLLGDDQVCLRE